VNAGTVTFPTNATLASTTNLTAGTIAAVSGAVGSVTGSVGSVVGHTAQTGDTYALANGVNGFVAIKADTAAILTDTGTTLEATVNAIKTKTDFLPSATAGAAGGVFIAGSNAATSITTALTANITGNVTGNLSGSVGSVTGAVGSVTGAVGSVTGLTASNLDVAVSTLGTAAALATVDTVVDAIKAKTDSLTFTKALEIDANIQSINGVTITGNGSTGTEFGV
ncbi:MAG TPA: hypothetical protein VJJ83_04255, partial [Candidatus Babeliales bacterium]|nr:hypothetical protein [Candidatus Babeliales bacterium]